MKNFKQLLLACFMTMTVITPTTINNTATATVEPNMIKAMQEYVGIIDKILGTTSGGDWAVTTIDTTIPPICQTAAGNWFDRLLAFDSAKDKKMIVNHNPIFLKGSGRSDFVKVAGEMILHLNAERLIFDILDFVKDRKLAVVNTGLKDILAQLFPEDILRLYEPDPLVTDFDVTRSLCVTLRDYEELFDRFITAAAAASNLEKLKSEKKLIEHIRDIAKAKLTEKRGCTLVTHKTAFQTLIMAALAKDGSGAPFFDSTITLRHIVYDALNLDSDVSKENTIIQWCKVLAGRTNLEEEAPGNVEALAPKKLTVKSLWGGAVKSSKDNISMDKDRTVNVIMNQRPLDGKLYKINSQHPAIVENDSDTNVNVTIDIEEKEVISQEDLAAGYDAKDPDYPRGGTDGNPPGYMKVEIGEAVLPATHIAPPTLTFLNDSLTVSTNGNQKITGDTEIHVTVDPPEAYPEEPVKVSKLDNGKIDITVEEPTEKKVTVITAGSPWEEREYRIPNRAEGMTVKVNIPSQLTYSSLPDGGNAEYVEMKVYPSAEPDPKTVSINVDGTSLEGDNASGEYEISNADSGMEVNVTAKEKKPHTYTSTITKDESGKKVDVEVEVDDLEAGDLNVYYTGATESLIPQTSVGVAYEDSKIKVTVPPTPAKVAIQGNTTQIGSPYTSSNENMTVDVKTTPNTLVPTVTRGTIGDGTQDTLFVDVPAKITVISDGLNAKNGETSLTKVSKEYENVTNTNVNVNVATTPKAPHKYNTTITNTGDQKVDVTFGVQELTTSDMNVYYTGSSQAIGGTNVAYEDSKIKVTVPDPKIEVMNGDASFSPKKEYSVGEGGTNKIKVVTTPALTNAAVSGPTDGVITVTVPDKKLTVKGNSTTLVNAATITGTGTSVNVVAQTTPEVSEQDGNYTVNVPPQKLTVTGVTGELTGVAIPGEGATINVTKDSAAPTPTLTGTAGAYTLNVTAPAAPDPKTVTITGNSTTLVNAATITGTGTSVNVVATGMTPTLAKSGDSYTVTVPAPAPKKVIIQGNGSAEVGTGPGPGVVGGSGHPGTTSGAGEQTALGQLLTVKVQTNPTTLRPTVTRGGVTDEDSLYIDVPASEVTRTLTLNAYQGETQIGSQPPITMNADKTVNVKIDPAPEAGKVYTIAANQPAIGSTTGTAIDVTIGITEATAVPAGTSKVEILEFFNDLHTKTPFAGWPDTPDQDGVSKKAFVDAFLNFTGIKEVTGYGFGVQGKQFVKFGSYDGF